MALEHTMMRRATASASGFASTFLRRSRNTPMGLDVTARATGSLAGCVGGRVMEDVDTPSLLVDLEAFDRNCNRLKQVMAQWPAVSVRPHVKAHKCAELALRQMRILGIQGVCAQKVAEAEAMAEGGISDILLSNEVVARRKLDRLVYLAAAGAKISVCVDGEVGLRELAAAAAKQGTSVGVVIEVNVGHDRCGVDTPAEAAKLAAAIASFPSLEFLGIQAYHGAQQHVRDPVDRHQRVVKSCSRASAAIQAIKDKAGLDCRVVTGGGTGTFHLEAASGIYTEVQPGSFCFGDVDYSKNRADPGTPGDCSGQWEQSLWVLTQVMSSSESRNMVVVDAGSKAVSLDSGPPLLPTRFTDGLEVEYQNGGDEHGKLLWPQAAYQLPPSLPSVGSMLMLQPGHCDPTVNLYDQIVAYKGDRVESVFDIRGRGPGY